MATGRVHSHGADAKSLAIAPPSAVEWRAQQLDKVHMGTIGLFGHPPFLESILRLVCRSRSQDHATHSLFRTQRSLAQHESPR